MSTVVLPSGAIKIVRARKLPRIDKLRDEDAADPKKVARTLNALIEEQAKFAANAFDYVEYQDLVIASGGNTFQLHHGFGGAARWWLTRYKIHGGSSAPIIQEWPALTDDNNLGFWTDTDSAVTIRIVPAGV